MMIISKTNIAIKRKEIGSNSASNRVSSTASYQKYVEESVEQRVEEEEPVMMVSLETVYVNVKKPGVKCECKATRSGNLVGAMTPIEAAYDEMPMKKYLCNAMFLMAILLFIRQHTVSFKAVVVRADSSINVDSKERFIWAAGEGPPERGEKIENSIEMNGTQVVEVVDSGTPMRNTAFKKTMQTTSTVYSCATQTTKKPEMMSQLTQTTVIAEKHTVTALVQSCTTLEVEVCQEASPEKGIVEESERLDGLYLLDGKATPVKSTDERHSNCPDGKCNKCNKCIQSDKRKEDHKAYLKMLELLDERMAKWNAINRPVKKSDDIKAQATIESVPIVQTQQATIESVPIVQTQQATIESVSIVQTQLESFTEYCTRMSKERDAAKNLQKRAEVTTLVEVSPVKCEAILQPVPIGDIRKKQVKKPKSKPDNRQFTLAQRARAQWLSHCKPKTSPLPIMRLAKPPEGTGMS